MLAKASIKRDAMVQLNTRSVIITMTFAELQKLYSTEI